MFTNLTILTVLTLIAPILAAGLLYGLALRLLSHWDRRLEAPGVVSLADASTTAETDATRSARERAPQAA